MPDSANYAARPLSASREYVGYQFYAQMTLDGHSADECFRYVALTLQNWLCERITNANREIPEAFRCVPAADFMTVDSSVLHSGSTHVAGITTIPEEGIWSLWVREPDPKVIGRSYLTHTAVRIKSESVVEFGVYIDVIDRVSSAAEAEFAFRPKFVRLLFQSEGLHLFQNVPLLFKDYTVIVTKKDLKALLAVADDPDNLMPLVVFTHAEEKQPTAEEIFQRMAAGQDKLPPIGSLSARTATDFSAMPVHIPPKDPSHHIPINRKTIRKYKLDDPRKDDKPAGQQQPKSSLPYDVKEFALHTYGFGKVFVLSEDLFDELQSKLNQAKFSKGDILLFEPGSFGGQIHVYPYRPNLSNNAYATVTKSLQDTLTRYSKRKPYRFGGLMFEEAARNRLKEIELEDMRRHLASTRSEAEAALLRQLEEERSHSAELQQQITALRDQLTDEFQRGAASEHGKFIDLDEKLTQAKAENADLQDKIDAMQAGFAEVPKLRQALSGVRSIRNLPQTNEDVISYFLAVYPDRIDFTDQGARTAAKCGIKPEILWSCLYDVANDLCDIHRDNPPDVEAVFKERTGWEVSMCEGSQTRSNPNLMALRKDTYQGREISIEPHVKFDRSEKKTGAAYQRLYYCYDALTRLIIVGYVGDHMDNHSTLGFS